MVFIIKGEPVAQGRPRLTTIGGKPRAYDPPKSKQWKDMAKEMFWIQMKQRKYQMVTNACKVSIKVYRSIPKSFPKKKIAMCQNGIIRPTQKPDLDNYIKAVKDSMSGIVWKDDNLVVDYFDCGKYYTEEGMIPRIEVIVMELE